MPDDKMVVKNFLELVDGANPRKVQRVQELLGLYCALYKPGDLKTCEEREEIIDIICEIVSRK